MQRIKEAFLINLLITAMLFMVFGVAESESDTAVFGQMPIYRAETEDKNIALMINVYEGAEYVLEYLELFEKENIRATFFIGGCWAEKNRSVVEKIADSQNEIGNHGYNHKLHTKLSEEDSINEIKKTNELLKDITGKDCTLFAPPSGDVNEQVVKQAEKLKMQTVMWSADTIDWRDQSVKKIYDRVERNLKPGVLVLMHPTAATLKALPEIILLCKSQGYTFMTVSEIIK